PKPGLAARLLLSEPPTAERLTSSDEVARHRAGWRRLARPQGGISKPLHSFFVRALAEILFKSDSRF
ncbi:MAG: hypothetical protein K2G93_03490, partial [Rikenella sp.]|nr:hypothetical protein [Rikenella sp.]